MKKGFWQAFPVVVAYLALSFAYGVSAAESGISFGVTVLMSMIVFAGSSQMIAVGMFAGGFPVYSIVLTTFIVNVRHFLLASALAPYLSHWPTWRRALFSLELTDEAFALHSNQFASEEGVPPPAQVFAVNIFPHMAWITGSTLGFIAKSGIDINRWGLDYALSAMFIALLILQTRTRLLAVVAILSASMSLGFNYVGWEGGSVILSTIIGATVGLLVERWLKKQST